jgi:uncharacterized protein YyaL (SSP411 family)
MNKLANENSPYLLQHANNPVDWYPWGEEALERARREDKPILVSIGYSTCHWCHVMERESFEDKEVAGYMNEYFINIKVDREERPDIDHIYMMAVQALTGSGGWPLNCFLTPDGRPFYGGTYYPPMPAHNRPSWFQLLLHLSKTFQEKRDVVEKQADRITELIRNGEKRFFDDSLGPEGTEAAFDSSYLRGVFGRLKEDFDQRYGGFGGAPKFPGTMSLEFLLAYYSAYQEDEALNHVIFSLEKMIKGGIYDQLGGGFARYATDSAWLVPHFEKMLYDNALLTGLMADTYKVMPSPLLETAIRETLTFIEREMTDKSGGFYSALDADSEGVEGKFYVWSKEEVDEVLGENAPLFCAYYDVTEKGNWEGTNILHRDSSLEAVASGLGISAVEAKERLSDACQRLFARRAERIRPGLDDKVLLSWNALQASAYAKAYQALVDEQYKETCLRNLDFLWENLRDDNGRLLHSYKDGQAKGIAFLDDYAFFIEALLDGYQVSFRKDLLDRAALLAEETIRLFADPEGAHFFFSPEGQKDIILRKKEVYDSATPSGNAVMAGNLQKLGLLLDKPEYSQRASRLLASMKESVSRFPSSFSRFALNTFLQVHPPLEIAIVGEEVKARHREVLGLYAPGALIMGAPQSDDRFPLLEGKSPLPDGSTAIYLCRNYACQRPVTTIGELKQLINKIGVK